MDFEQLRMLELSPALIQRWRHRGTTPGPAVYGQPDQDLVCQFLIARRT
jgi:hypothetical protein